VVLVLALALVGSVQATCTTVAHCDTCDANTPPACSVCSAGYWPTSGGLSCLACDLEVIKVNTCSTGEFWNSSTCGPTHKGCQACALSTCTARYANFYDSTKCGTTDHRGDSGCYQCTDCVSALGPHSKAWGVCSGPSGTENPEFNCLVPGAALCRLCSTWVEDWLLDHNSNPWSQDDCDAEVVYNHDWVYEAGKDEDDLIAACLAAKADQDLDEYGVCYFVGQVNMPFVSQFSCLYNGIVDAMNIYDAGAGGWPLPQDYPLEPFNVTM